MDPTSLSPQASALLRQFFGQQTQQQMQQSAQQPQPTYCGGTRSPASLTAARVRQAAKRLPRQ